MKCYRDKYNRHSIRLKGYNYSQEGAYFATLCTKGRKCLFGNLLDSKVLLNEFGQIVEESWLWLEQNHTYVALDEWIIMPNHLHGIIIIARGGLRTAPTTSFEHKPLGRLIGAFKTISTKQINLMLFTPGIPVWQRNYYEHVIRNEEDLNECREYIINNPLKWEIDNENPRNMKVRAGLKPALTNNVR